ncbi:uncharacterized protein LDX57_005171 [Aspergillus melleus]|uniref:uncharacterized protein n=1 Tax=Aspergillus melleus TaxID=138277 RepID=UPI001E8E38B8|nr:uncharacterized protein LDX57_005171 [Aspergillus melleus]KAH8427458.1 hypothetical protein LDX57_005171 [Aspergillus melleus]
MFFCWGTKPDKDEFPYVWYYQAQPLRKAQKHDGHLRAVCPVVGPPTPGASNVPRPDHRRRDHATEQPHVSRAARSGSSSGSGSGSGSDSPVRDSTYHIQYQRSNIYSSCAETGSLSRRASPNFNDEILVSSSGSSQEDVFVSRREHSRLEHLPTGYRGEDDHDEARRPSAGYRPSTNRPSQVHYSVRSSQSSVETPRPERRAEYFSLPIRSQRVRYPTGSESGSGSERGRERERRHGRGRERGDSRPPRQENTRTPQRGLYDPEHADGNARPARTQRVQFERSASRSPRARLLSRPRPRPCLVDNRQQDDSTRRDSRHQMPWDRVSVVRMCECDICQSDAYS